MYLIDFQRQFYSGQVMQVGPNKYRTKVNKLIKEDPIQSVV